MKFPFHADKTQIQIAREFYYKNLEKKEQLIRVIEQKNKDLQELQKEILRLDNTINFLKTNK